MIPEQRFSSLITFSSSSVPIGAVGLIPLIRRVGGQSLYISELQLLRAVGRRWHKERIIDALPAAYAGLSSYSAEKQGVSPKRQGKRGRGVTPPEQHCSNRKVLSAGAISLGRSRGSVRTRPSPLATALVLEGPWEPSPSPGPSPIPSMALESRGRKLFQGGMARHGLYVWTVGPERDTCVP